ncbi:MAG: hypothetical protein ACR2PM_14250, partial [Hyphomicrobiales bacterium]
MDEKELNPTSIDGTRDDMAPGLSRRSFFVAAGAAGVGAAADVAGASQAQDTPPDWQQPGNNN